MAAGGWHPRYVEGVRLFNERRWFEAHEVLEDVWNAEPDPRRRFYQGLIQAAVALEHWRRGNARGACSQWTQAREKLVPFAPRHAGLDVSAFVSRMDVVMAPIVARPPHEWRGGVPVPVLDETAAPRIDLR